MLGDNNTVKYCEQSQMNEECVEKYEHPIDKC